MCYGEIFMTDPSDKRGQMDPKNQVSAYPRMVM